jgi:hypothetical protein
MKTNYAPKTQYTADEKIILAKAAALILFGDVWSGEKDDPNFVTYHVLKDASFPVQVRHPGGKIGIRPAKKHLTPGRI